MKRKSSKLTYFIVATIALFGLVFYGCGDKSVPKPYGYFRIDLPNHTYNKFDTASFPYQFDKSTLTTIRYRKAPKVDEQWLDVVYPQLRAVIHCSYLPITNNLNELTEDSRNIVYKHSVRADAIEEQRYENREKKVYAILYTLSGNVASPVQFAMTDSIKHFFRGVLYFENVPNKDSIAPVANYVREDVVRLMESFEWK